ncbi:MAG: tRNA epoxyqueuosine(34) reductase QueG, partial [Brevundimonas sp.]
NSGDVALIPTVKSLLHDPAPIVRGAAVWALSRLDPLAPLDDIRPSEEPDETVLAEWAIARSRQAEALSQS